MNVSSPLVSFSVNLFARSFLLIAFFESTLPLITVVINCFGRLLAANLTFFLCSLLSFLTLFIGLGIVIE